MSIWDLNQWIESRIPAWTILIPLGIVIYILVRYEKFNDRSGD